MRFLAMSTQSRDSKHGSKIGLKKNSKSYKLHDGYQYGDSTSLTSLFTHFSGKLSMDELIESKYLRCDLMTLLYSVVFYWTPSLDPRISQILAGKSIGPE